MPKHAYKRELTIARRQHVDALLGALSAKSNLGVRNRMLILILARTGVRLSELRSIRISRIDFAERTIYLPKTKSGRPHTVALDPTTLAAVQRWIDRRRLVLGISDRIPLVCSCQGQPVSGSGIRETLKRLARKAKIDYLSPIAFRRGFAVTVASRLPITIVSQALNHVDPLVTMLYLRKSGIANEAIKFIREFDWQDEAGAAS